MRDLTNVPTTGHGFVRSAVALGACILAVALLLIPFAMRQAGSGGLVGLIVAAFIALFSGWIAEGLTALLASTSPLGAMLIGMFVRMAPPLLLCVAMVALGQNGRQHLAFIGYLLAFYLVTLALETWLAVKRASGAGTAFRHSAR